LTGKGSDQMSIGSEKLCSFCQGVMLFREHWWGGEDEDTTGRELIGNAGVGCTQWQKACRHQGDVGNRGGSA